MFKSKSNKGRDLIVDLLPSNCSLMVAIGKLPTDPAYDECINERNKTFNGFIVIASSLPRQRDHILKFEECIKQQQTKLEMTQDRVVETTILNLSNSF